MKKTSEGHSKMIRYTLHFYFYLLVKIVDILERSIYANNIWKTQTELYFNTNAFV